MKLPIFFLSPLKVSALYVASSVFTGPAILLAGWSIFTAGKGDYCDSVYNVPGGRALAAAEFHRAQIFQVSVAATMLLIGVCLAYWLIVSGLKDKRRTAVYAALLILIAMMMFGYGLVITLSGKGGQSC